MTRRARRGRGGWGLPFWEGGGRGGAVGFPEDPLGRVDAPRGDAERSRARAAHAEADDRRDGRDAAASARGGDVGAGCRVVALGAVQEPVELLLDPAEANAAAEVDRLSR